MSTDVFVKMSSGRGVPRSVESVEFPACCTIGYAREPSGRTTEGHQELDGRYSTSVCVLIKVSTVRVPTRYTKLIEFHRGWKACITFPTTRVMRRAIAEVSAGLLSGPREATYAVRPGKTRAEDGP